MLRGAISSDIDTLQSIYGGRGCRRAGGYTYDELRIGLDNHCKFFDRYRIKTTLFMVGDDFRRPADHALIRGIADAGHEIANHTSTHAQGFRLLSPADKETEIAGMEDACFAVTGARPIGFRSPGWNMGDDAIGILKRRGYLYDSSVHPMSLMPVFKFLHWWNTSKRTGGDRTTLGHLSYMFAPLRPYQTGPATLARPGRGGLVELPLTVVPGVRFPFWATLLLATGYEMFAKSYRILRSFDCPIQYQFHLSDFVDYTTGGLPEQVPGINDGVYVPQALRVPLQQKWDLFERAMDLMAKDYQFVTLREWAQAV